MQRITRLVEQRRGDIGADQQNRRIRLQTLQKWYDSEQIAWPCRSEHSSNFP